MGMERREAFRWTINAQAQIGIDGETATGVIVDISRFGMMIETSLRITPSHSVVVATATPKGTQIDFEGKTVWSKAANIEGRTRFGLRLAGDPYYLDKAVWTCVLETLGQEGSRGGHATTLAEIYFGDSWSDTGAKK